MTSKSIVHKGEEVSYTLMDGNPDVVFLDRITPIHLNAVSIIKGDKSVEDFPPSMRHQLRNIIDLFNVGLEKINASRDK